MQLWDDLLRIRGLRLHLMHYGMDIRANYAVCVCGEYVVAGSVAVIHFFTSFFTFKKMAVTYMNPYIL